MEKIAAAASYSRNEHLNQHYCEAKISAGLSAVICN